MASGHSGRAVTQCPIQFISSSQLPCWDRGLLQGDACPSMSCVRVLCFAADQSLVLSCRTSSLRESYSETQMQARAADSSVNKVQSICPLWTVNFPMRWHMLLTQGALICGIWKGVGASLEHKAMDKLQARPHLMPWHFPQSACSQKSLSMFLERQNICEPGVTEGSLCELCEHRGALMAYAVKKQKG